MKLLQKILIVLAIILILLIAIAFMLPRQWSVERSIDIHSTPQQIHAYVDNLKQWQEWTPWTKEFDPTLQYTYEGPIAGVGATERWTSEKLGQGVLRITDSDPEKGIRYELQFENEKRPVDGQITYERQEDLTKVTWQDNGDLGNNPINRYFGVLMQSMLGTQLESGLAKLKQKVEASKSP